MCALEQEFKRTYTEKELRVLRWLKGGESYRASISRRINISTGTLDRMLAKMQEAGWVTSRQLKLPHQLSKHPLRMWSITKAGLKELERWEDLERQLEE